MSYLKCEESKIILNVNAARVIHIYINTLYTNYALSRGMNIYIYIYIPYKRLTTIKSLAFVPLVHSIASHRLMMQANHHVPLI